MLSDRPKLESLRRKYSEQIADEKIGVLRRKATCALLVHSACTPMGVASAPLTAAIAEADTQLKNRESVTVQVSHRGCARAHGPGGDGFGWPAHSLAPAPCASQYEQFLRAEKILKASHARSAAAASHTFLCASTRSSLVPAAAASQSSAESTRAL